MNAQGIVLDVTFGNGTFWKSTTRSVVGLDREIGRARDICADFTALPFRNSAFPVVVYDPPFHPKVNSAEETRFRAMGGNERELRTGFEAGLRECWRVVSYCLIVKCQGFVHNHAPQWMPLWAIGVLGEPFEWLIVHRDGKRISGRWRQSLSLRRNHADYLLFNKRGNRR